MKLAVIKTGGKQYLVTEGQILKVEKIKADKSNKVKFDNILLVADDKTNKIDLGQPKVSGLTVEAEVLEQGRNRKVRVTKYKAKTRYHIERGHRQPYTKVKILKIGATQSKPKTAKKPASKITKKQ